MSKSSYIFIAIAIVLFSTIFNYSLLGSSSTSSRSHGSGGGVYGGGVGGHK